MFDYENYRDYLNDELVRRTGINPSYSQRAFAKALGLSPGEFSEILRSKRKLSLKSAFKIARALGLTSRETKHFIGLVDQESERRANNEKKNILDHSNAPFRETKLTIDQFDVVSEWYHFAILNLADTQNFQWSFTWIAKKLNIKVFLVKNAIDKMINIGLIKRIDNKDGTMNYKISNDYVMPMDGIPSKAVRNYHKQMLGKAIDSLEFQSIEERDITGIGLAINREDLKKIKQDISDFQDMLVEKYSMGKKERAYQLEVALFALSEDDL